jgi:hypothetical protein
MGSNMDTGNSRRSTGGHSRNMDSNMDTGISRSRGTDSLLKRKKRGL